MAREEKLYLPSWLTFGRDAGSGRALRGDVAYVVALDASVDKLKNSVGSALAPALGRAVDEFARLADDYGPKIAHWIDNVDWDKTAKSIAGVGEALGGVKGIALAVAAVTFAGPIAGLASMLVKATALSGVLMPLAANPIVAGALGLLYSQGLNKGEGDTRLTQPGDVWDGDPIGARRRGGAAADSQTASIVNSMMLKGWTREQAAGIAANLWAESMYNPGAIGDNGHAYGIAQWHEDRQAEFKKRFGIDIRKSTLDQQLQFVDYELRKGNEQAAGNALSTQDSAVGAGGVVSRLYERPADPREEYRRGQMASEIDSASKRNYGTQKLEVTIHMPGAPHGTRASVHSNGEVMATGQIGHSLLMGP